MAIATACTVEHEDDAFATIRRGFEALPADQYPSLVALAPYLTDQDSDDRFRFGLATLLDGLAARLAG